MAKKKVTEKQTLQDVIDELNRLYGKGTIISLDEKQSGEYNVISTGSIGFDYKVLGIGGVARGKLYEIRGWEGVGKSTFVAAMAANCQNIGGKVAYIDGEHAVDMNYFKALGVDTNNILLSQPDYGEQGFDVAEKVISSGGVDLVIIDSDSSLIPKSIMEDPIGTSKIGKKASLNSTVYPKIKMLLEKNNCCLVVISQYRERIGVMFGDPKITQGGHALKFTADTIIELSKRLVKEGEETLAIDTKIKTIKNKTFPPFKETRVNIIFGKGVDSVGELIELAVEYNIITKSGAFYKKDGETLAKGDLQMRQILIDNPGFFDEIKGIVIEKIKLGKSEEVEQLIEQETI